MGKIKYDVENLIGKTFGRLTILGASHTDPKKVVCRCTCGTVKEVDYRSVVSGHTKSCGCLRSGRKHGESGTRLYSTWREMIQRCENKENKAYDRYGGRGITVYDKWKAQDGYETFRTWAMKNGYTDDLYLNRKNTNGNYTPKNCFFGDTPQVPQDAGRPLLQFDGRSMSIADWARELDIPVQVLYSRFAIGWSVERTLSEPLHERGWTATPHSRLHDVWKTINDRCSKEDAVGYSYNGGRGVKVCEEWTGPEGYKAFAAWAAEHGYTDDLYLWRKDTREDYSPDNCFFDERVQNGASYGRRFIEFRGERLSMTQWAKKLGMSKQTLQKRLDSGWSVQRALTEPVGAHPVGR